MNERFCLAVSLLPKLTTVTLLAGLCACASRGPSASLDARSATSAPTAAASTPESVGEVEDRRATDAALHEGVSAGRSCSEFIEYHGAPDYASCIDARARLIRRGDALDDVRSLGAWYAGWWLGDLAGGNGVEEAQQAADGALPMVLALQKKLNIDDQRLCGALVTTCERMIARKREATAALGLR